MRADILPLGHKANRRARFMPRLGVLYANEGSYRRMRADIIPPDFAKTTGGYYGKEKIVF
jgi:hypothetical protein